MIDNSWKLDKPQVSWKLFKTQGGGPRLFAIWSILGITLIYGVCFLTIIYPSGLILYEILPATGLVTIPPASGKGDDNALSTALYSIAIVIVHFILTFIIQLLHRRDDFSGFIKNGYLASASIFLIVTMWGVVNGDFRKSFVILSIFAATLLINLLLYRFLEIQKFKIKTTLYISGVSLTLISILSLIYFRQEYSFYREGAATTIGILISLFLLQFLTYIFLRGLSRLANTRNWADKPKYHEHM